VLILVLAYLDLHTLLLIIKESCCKIAIIKWTFLDSSDQSMSIKTKAFSHDTNTVLQFMSVGTEIMEMLMYFKIIATLFRNAKIFVSSGIDKLLLNSRGTILWRYCGFGCKYRNANNYFYNTVIKDPI